MATRSSALRGRRRRRPHHARRAGRAEQLEPRDGARAARPCSTRRASDADVRALLLTGEGRAFCAGQDLAEVVPPDGSPGPGASRRSSRENYNPLVRRIVALEKPIVCAVNGVAAGAGANLALACDVVLAATNASFIQAFVNIGLDARQRRHLLPAAAGRAWRARRRSRCSAIGIPRGAGARVRFDLRGARARAARCRSARARGAARRDADARDRPGQARAATRALAATSTPRSSASASCRARRRSSHDYARGREGVPGEAQAALRGEVVRARAAPSEEQA